MARFLVDEDLPRTVSRALEGAGHDAVHVIDVGLRGASDDDVLAHACAERRVLVSADVGFGNILRYPPGTHAGILVSRLPNEMPTSEVVGRLLASVSAFEEGELEGALVVVSMAGTRIRRGSPGAS